MDNSIFGIANDEIIVSTYTRKEAIEDGVLVDMSQSPFGESAREAGIKWPIAMTSAAYEGFVAVTSEPGHACQDVNGRWWDVVWMFVRTRHEVTPLETRWKVFVRDPDGNLREKELKCVSGPADDGSPCLTFMLPDED